jgi:peptidoglycan/LPS O-acetylase OafA/YrhL
MTVSNGTWMVFASPFVFCAFVLAFMGDGGAISRVLRTAPFQLLAELSFAIYMVHALVLIFILAGLHGYERIAGLALFQQIPNPLAGGPGAATTVEVLHTSNGFILWTCALIYISAVMGSAYAAYRFIEVPGRALFGRLAKRLSSRRPVSETLSPLCASSKRAS